MIHSITSIVVACVATINLGVQNNTAKTITEAFNQKNNLPVENIEQKQDISLEEILEPQSVSSLLAKPVIHVASKAIELLSAPSKPAVEKPNHLTETADKTVQGNEPKVEAPIEEPAPAAMSISDQEKDLFARLVEAEAKGEPYEGKVAVATVVLNRVDSPQFPDTVTEVIHEVVGDAYAFSPVQNGEINNPASEESTQAVEEALNREDTLNQSIYFYNPEIATDDWIQSRETVETIGNHVFAK